MADVAELLVLLSGNADGAKRAISDTGKGLSGLDSSSSHTSSVFSKLGKDMVKALEIAATAATAIAGVGAVAVKMAMDFQTSQTQLVTGAGESQKNLAMVSAGILAMAGTVGQSAGDLSKGMFLIESAGYHGAAGLAVLKAAAEGAAVGGAQMTTVADALTTALHDYNLPASDANRVTSALVETVAMGKTNLEDLAGSIGKVMPVASALGISFQQVTGAMATMTNAGLSARFAAMHLNTTLLALSAPSAVAAKSMKEVGLTTQGVKNILDGPGGLAAALADIEDHVGKKFPAGSVASVAALKNITGGTVGYSTALMLTGANSATFESNVKNIGKVLTGSNKQVQGFSAASHDFSFALKSVGDAAQAAMISFGTKLLPVLTTVATWLGQEIPVAVTVLDNAFTWIGTNVLPVVENAFKAIWGWVEQNRKTLLTIAGVLLGVVATGFKVLADGVTFIVQHKNVFVGLGLAVAAIFVIGHAKAWATDAIQNIGKVFSAVKNAPSAVMNFFTGGGSKTSAIGSDVKNLAGDVQKVYVVNMPEGGMGGSGNPASAVEGDAATAAEGAGGAGGAEVLGGGLLAGGAAGTAAAVLAPLGMLASSALADWTAIQAVSKNLQKSITGIQGKAISDFTAFGLSASASAAGAQAVAKAVQDGAIKTPQQFQAFITNWENANKNSKAAVLSAFDIALSMKTASENLSSLPSSSASIAAGLAALHKAIPTSMHLPTGGVGFFSGAGGGLADAPLSGGLALLHGREYVVPESLASPSLRASMVAAIAGKKVGTAIPASLAGAAASAGAPYSAGPTQINNYYGVAKETVDLIDARQKVNNTQLIRQLQAGRR